jgi:hypothetical protein
MTAGEYLKMVRERGPMLAPEALDRIEEAKQADRPARDKWTED